MYKCPYCGKEFGSKSKGLAGHISHCSKNPNSVKTNSLECNKERDDLFCQYCGKQYKTQNSLHQHELRCKLNSNKISPVKSGFTIAYERGWDPSWNRGLTKETDERVRLNAERISEAMRGENNSFKDKHHTKESKEKIRIGTINYLNTLGDGIKVRYNKSSCQFIDDLNETLGWNLQHAENGGEVCVGGYFLDGYDKDLNIAFEYDEPAHYKDVYKNILKESDLERMNFIKEKIGCRFFRYNETLNTLYEI